MTTEIQDIYWRQPRDYSEIPNKQKKDINRIEQDKKSLATTVWNNVLKNFGEALPVIKSPRPKEAKLSADEMMKQRGKRIIGPIVAGFVLSSALLLYGLEKNYNSSIKEIFSTTKEFYSKPFLEDFPIKEPTSTNYSSLEEPF